MKTFNAEAQRRREKETLICVHLCRSAAKRILPSPLSPRLCASALKSSSSGFSLLEMIAAIAIVTSGVFATIQMMQHSLASSRVFIETQAVTTALQNEIEALRAMKFSELSDRQNAAFIHAPEGLDRLVDVQPSLTIQPAPDGTPGLKEVCVHIAWKVAKGPRIAKSLQTLIADRGGA